MVISGGGSRCLWQAAFWEVLAEHPYFQPKTIACVSAGATMACLVLARKSTESLEHFKEVTRKNRRNIYLSNLLNDKPIFPHCVIYRHALLTLFDNESIQRTQSGPEIKVLITQPPRWLGPRLGTLIGMGANTLEKKLIYPMHPQLASRIGFTPLMLKANDCQTVEELADLLLQSSCTLPFVPIMRRKGRPTLDGGLIDNVPVHALDGQGGKMLVLLSR